MGFADFFRKKKKDTGPDPVRGTTLFNMKKGWMVDFDMETYEVLAANVYDWGHGDKSFEWQLKSVGKSVYLEMESDDEEEWSLSEKVPFSRLDPSVREQILDTGDPPDTVVFDGKTFYLEQMGGGHFLADASSISRELLRWDYEDDDGETFLCIEQWGEDDFDAAIGRPVKPWQFQNILPGPGERE